MSEKNGQGEQQWTKGAAAAVLSQKQQQQHIQQGILTSYNANVGAVDLGLTTPANSLFCGAGHIGSGSNHQHNVVPYASARFQAPPLDHHVASAATVSSHVVSQTSPPNMPVPSGFVPPPFSSSNAATTSVVMPNPYAVASLTGQGAILTSTNHPHSAASTTNQQFPPGLTHPTPTPSPHPVHGHFGIDQFQHLNAQQHYELSKLMAASFGTNQMHGSATGPTNLTSTSAGNLSTVATSNIHVVPQSSVSVRQQTHPQSAAAIAADGPNSSCSGAINVQVAEQVIGTISTGTTSSKLATTPIHGRLMGLGIQAPDDEKLKRIQDLVESGVGENAKQQIVQILDRISTLRPVEKLLLYLRLPGEQPETDPLRQPQNPLGTRSEINHTINWVRTHLEQDPQVSIPKQDVYNDYLVYCDRLDIKPLSTADFGKVMKQVFPGIRPRRLGTRGHSRYCYAAMRKTSKLPTPHLPTLSTSTNILNKGVSTDVGLESVNTVIDNIDEEEESWDVVKHWAENALQIKVNDLKDLAKQIKSNATGTVGLHTNATYAAGTAKTGSATSKKYAQREPKEKRVMADMGPLKKRRKKKRKGSSSSESSCNPLSNVIADIQQQMPVNSQLSPANSSKSSSHNILSPAVEDSQKSINLVNIKQEFIDSPGYPSPIGASDPSLSMLADNKHGTQYHSHFNHNQQQQMMPINLAAETKGGTASSRASSTVTASAFEHVRPPGLTSTTTTAVKNLTPKIMELSTENQTLSSSSPSQTVIKQEIGTDDYNTSNIFCKKVRKAQQTKGYWVNSPTSSNRTSSTSSLPIITTTASTPPPTSASVITSPPNSSNSLNSGAVSTTNYSMGPPAQMAPSTSPNNQSIHDEVLLGQPKVLSRNLQQLRAKRFMTATATGNCDPPDLSVVKDAADLPENLGLPRERVISICNMDKHELDDYFLPVEEENSEDQESELLQYFQMGDAEEKLIKNSSSDAKRISNPTVPAHMTTSTTTQLVPTSLTMSSTRTMSTTTNNVNKAERVVKNDVYNGKLCKQLSQQALNYLKNHSYPSLIQNKEQCSTKLPLSKTATTLTVGTASASLEQITQKHQHQHSLQNQSSLLQLPHKPQPPTAAKISNKRKINLNSSSTSDITAARKNYSFLPISPNINTTSSSANTSNDTGFFASPGFSRLLTKQQSLDCESSCDPMIGATRRRRTYMSLMTSASAPPSPSVLKQQQEQQILGFPHNILMDQWPSSNSAYNNNSSINPSNALLVEQNSLDLDLFGEAAAAAASPSTSTSVGPHFHLRSTNFDTIATNNCDNNNLSSSDSILNDLTQRSRSVPLSQLQRSHSPTFNRTFHMGPTNPTVYSTCNSLAQTPVPSEFIDSVTILSENSCSQHSASIKLEEVGNVVGSDSTALLDEVDVSEILSSPDFVTKFSSIAQTGCGTKTTCSSAGSSSGYSSAGQFSLSLSSYSNSGNGVGSSTVMSSSISRSVPSTPLPHQNPSSLLGNGGNNFYRRRFANNCQSVNNTAENMHSVSVKYGYGNMALSRSACDISKSMPSTPITTTPSNFRYSPSEFTRDFLINGNTIDDSITSSFGTVTNDNLMGSDVVGLDASLLNDDDSLVNGTSSTTIARGVDDVVITPDFTVQSDSSGLVNADGLGAGSGGESSVVIGVGSDILDSL